MKQIILSIVVISLACTIGSCTTSSEIEVPVNITGASDVGSLRFELYYDATILEFQEVEEGEIASAALFEFNVNNPGVIVMGIVDAAGINGNIQVAKIKFKVIQKETGCPLTLDNVLAYNAKTLAPISFKIISGNFGGSSKTLIPPELAFQR